MLRVLDEAGAGAGSGAIAAHVRMLDSGDVLRVDQLELETVVPAAGGAVRLLAGAQRGRRAELAALRVQDFAADLRLADGALLRAVPYEDFSREAPAA